MTPETLNTDHPTVGLEANTAHTINPANPTNKIPGLCPSCPSCPVWHQNQELAEENTRLEQRINQLEAQNKALTQRLARYENTHRPRPLKRLRRRSQTTTTRFPGRPRGHPGTTRPRPQPQIVVKADALGQCPECGMGLDQPYLTKHRVVEELPGLEPVTVVDYHEDHYLCHGCDCSIVARHPDCPPKGRFGKKVYVQTTLLKFEERLPLERVGKVLSRQGLDITEATVLELLDRVSLWLGPDYEKMLALVRLAGVVYTDQTGMKVDGVQYYIWNFVTDTETVYVIRPTKGKTVLEEVLGKGWPGILVCDGSRSHHSFTHNIQRCWAHILTEIDQITQHLLEVAQPGKAGKAGKAGKNQKDGKDGKGDGWKKWKSKDRDRDKDRDRCGERYRRYREAESLRRGLHRIYNTLKEGLEVLETDPPPSRPQGQEKDRLARYGRKALRYWLRKEKEYRSARVRKFVKKLRAASPYLFTAVNHPGVDLTNNRSERSLRNLVVQRKIIGTLRNGKGIRMYERLPSLLATWEQRGLDPSQTLSTALTQSWKPTNTHNQTKQPHS